MVFDDDRGFALQRVYGDASVQHLPELRIAVVGVGGVGSWAVEALARTGVGHLTLIDHDDVTVSNINRQIPALDSTVGQAKVAVLKDRIRDINPSCDVAAEEDFLVEKNLEHYLMRDFDMVIDAIDNIRRVGAPIPWRFPLRIYHALGTTPWPPRFAHGSGLTMATRKTPNAASVWTVCFPPNNPFIQTAVVRLRIKNPVYRVCAWIVHQGTARPVLSPAALVWWPHLMRYPRVWRGD